MFFIYSTVYVWTVFSLCDAIIALSYGFQMIEIDLQELNVFLFHSQIPDLICLTDASTWVPYYVGIYHSVKHFKEKRIF